MKLVNHNNIVKLLEVLASRTKIFIVIELVCFFAHWLSVQWFPCACTTSNPRVL
jgi:hypothetical protein